MGDPSNAVSPEWMFDVNSRLQRAVGDFLDPHPGAFRSAFVSLFRTLPHFSTRCELGVLHDKLRVFCLSAGRQFHSAFHAFAGAKCSGSPVESCDRMWSECAPGADPRATLTSWAMAFLEAFDSGHRWPPEMQVAMLLDRSFPDPPSIDDLARVAGMSRTQLAMAFTARYGLSIGTYERVVRAREAARRLQDTPDCVDAIARDVGYASTKNLYALLGRLTGLTPDAIRHSAIGWREVVPLPAPRRAAVCDRPPRIRTHAARDPGRRQSRSG